MFTISSFTSVRKFLNHFSLAAKIESGQTIFSFDKLVHGNANLKLVEIEFQFRDRRNGHSAVNSS